MKKLPGVFLIAALTACASGPASPWHTVTVENQYRDRVVVYQANHPQDPGGAALGFVPFEQERELRVFNPSQGFLVCIGRKAPGVRCSWAESAMRGEDRYEHLLIVYPSGAAVNMYD